jgi:hypothetical protein
VSRMKVFTSSYNVVITLINSRLYKVVLVAHIKVFLQQFGFEVREAQLMELADI